MIYNFSGHKIETSIRHLEQALALAETNKFYQEECHWFLGKAQLMLGNIDKARHQFLQVVSLEHNNLIHQDDARQMLKALSER